MYKIMCHANFIEVLPVSYIHDKSRPGGVMQKILKITVKKLLCHILLFSYFMNKLLETIRNTQFTTTLFSIPLYIRRICISPRYVNHTALVLTETR